MDASGNTENIATKPKTVCSKCEEKARVMQVIVSYLNVAQKRGAFSFEESAKIWQLLQITNQITKST
jgi:hypothetical protein